MASYGYAVGEAAVQVFASLPARRRARLLRILEDLARRPYQPGDYRETGASGRSYEVKLSDDLLLTWWVDHAAREVRVIRIESAE